MLVRLTLLLPVSRARKVTLAPVCQLAVRSTPILSYLQILLNPTPVLHTLCKQMGSSTYGVARHGQQMVMAHSSKVLPAPKGLRETKGSKALLALRAIKAILEHRAKLELPAHKGLKATLATLESRALRVILGHRATKELLDPKDLKVTKVNLASRVLRVILGHKASKGRKVCKVCKAKREIKETRGILAHKVCKAKRANLAKTVQLGRKVTKAIPAPKALLAQPGQTVKMEHKALPARTPQLPAQQPA